MSDILSALQQLEDLERDKRRKPGKGGKGSSVLSNTEKNKRAGRSRPRSVDVAKKQASQDPKSTNLSVDAHSGERSPSVASARRISFVDAPRPERTERRTRISTRTAALNSGFPYESTKLTKYGIGEEEWKDYSDALIEAADIPKRAAWAWRFHKNDVVKKMRREIQYEGDFKRILNAWNRHFKKKGFQVSLELPGPPRIKETDTPEEQEAARRESKFFNLCITPNADKGGSIYSRSSSMTRSVSGEGAAAKTPVHSDDDDEKDKEENE